MREQLENRANMEEKESRKKYMVVIGGSQMGMISREMERLGGEVIGVWSTIRLKDWTREEMEAVKEKLVECEGMVDGIVIGGLGGPIIL